MSNAENTSLIDLIQRAWQRVRPCLLVDQHDLAARIARRRRPVLTSPPRAACLAVRASDTRITAHGESVFLNAVRVRKLCTPVVLPAPGLMLDEVANLLGTTPMGLRNARLNGTLRTHHIKGLAGRRGKPVPLVYTDQPLDPNARGFANPDPAWRCIARDLLDRIPPDLHQVLTRHPIHISHTPRHKYRDGAHPELDTAPARKSKQLPPPQPDPVWYKWSTANYFLGTDPSNWRKGPQDLGLRPPRDLPKRRQKRRPRQRVAAGSLHFNGYRWTCPLCNRTCRTLFYPLLPLDLLTDLPRLAQIVDVLRPARGFACARCHRVQFFSRADPGAWNSLIAYLSTGLLYGHEVPRPDWFTKDRKRPYRARLGAKPPRRRRQVFDLLLQGQTRAQISAELRMSPSALMTHINKIYKSERLRGQRALLLKHNKPLPPHLVLRRDRILDLLKGGHSPETIAAELGLKSSSVTHYICDLRRQGKLAPHQTRRQQVAALHTAGFSRPQIAQKLNMTPQGVSTHLHELRRQNRLPPRPPRLHRAEAKASQIEN